MMKAFLITRDGWPSLQSYYAATTAGRARYSSYLSARDTSCNVEFRDFRVRRAPEFDWLAADKCDGQSLGWRDTRTGEAYGCCAMRKALREANA